MRLLREELRQKETPFPSLVVLLLTPFPSSSALNFFLPPSELVKTALVAMGINEAGAGVGE